MSTGPITERPAFFYRPAHPEPLPLRMIGDLIDLAVVAIGIALVGVMSVNVVFRTVLDADLAWNVEFGEFILVWVTFLGAAAAARRGAHMRISEGLAVLPPSVRRAVEIVSRLAVLALLVVLVRYGTIIALSQMDQQMTVLYWPVGLQYAAMPVGCLLAALFVVRELILLLRGLEPPHADADPAE